MRAVWTFVVLTLAVLTGNSQTNLGAGAIHVDCAGRTNLVWTNVGQRVVLEMSDLSGTNWEWELDVKWRTPSDRPQSFVVPLKSVGDRAFYRLVSWE